MEIAAIIEAHEDEGLDSLCDLKIEQDAYFHYSKSKKGEYFNRVRKIRSLEGNSVISKAERFYGEFESTPCFVINPLTTPKDFKEGRYTNLLGGIQLR